MLTPPSLLENAEPSDWKPGVRLVLQSLHLQALQMKTPTYIHLVWITFYTTFPHSHIEGLGVNHFLAIFFPPLRGVSNLVDWSGFLCVVADVPETENESAECMGTEWAVEKGKSCLTERERDGASDACKSTFAQQDCLLSADVQCWFSCDDQTLWCPACTISLPLQIAPLFLLLRFNCFFMGVAFVIACETSSLCGVLQRK